MTNEMLNILIIDYPDANRDCEVIVGEFAESVRDHLWELTAKGEIEYWEIRSGYLNGGDSRIEFSS